MRMKVWFLTVVGRRRVGNAVIDARRNLSGVCGRWCPVILDLHRFFIAISRAVWLIMMGMVVLLLILWFGLLVLFLRGVGWFTRFGIGHFLPGPLGIWDSEWVRASAISADDIAH